MPLRIIELPSTAAINSGDFFPVSQLVGSKRNTFRITTSQIKTFVTGELSQKVDDISAKVNSYGASKVSLSGDTMTGYLTLVDNPLNPRHASTKGYVDTRMNSLTSGFANNIASKYVQLTGDIMTGFLTLNNNPVNPMHAATKSFAETLVRSTSSVLTSNLNNYVRLDGSTMTGGLILNSNPTLNLQAVPKQYVDTALNGINSNLNNYVRLAGGFLTGYLTLHANPTNNMHPTTKGYTDAAVAAAVAGLGNNAAATYVKLAGDTMTGFLNLNANPTTNLHAATKQYTDTLVNTASSTTQTNITNLKNSVQTNYYNLTGTPLQADLNVNNYQLHKFSAKIIKFTSDAFLTQEHNGCILLFERFSPTNADDRIYAKINQNTLSVGFNVMIIQTGDVQVKVNNPDTLVSLVNSDASLSSRTKYSQINLCSIENNKIWISGDIV